MFALDANVLLNVYGYSESTREVLLRLFGVVKERLWMPHQFALEYQRNRSKTILEQAGNYRTAGAQLKKLMNEHLKPRHLHPFVSQRSMKAVDRICRELSDGENRHLDLLRVDPYFDQISDLLEGRVGPEPSKEALAAMHEEAVRRINARVPPGYADSEKPEPDRFGDFVGRCCTNRHWPARCQPTGSSPADAIRHWSAEIDHPIEDLTAEDGLTPLPSWTPGAKAIADDGLVAEERVLHPALTMVP